MGAIFSIAPISTRFLIGFGLGYGVIVKLPEESFITMRKRIFPVIEEVTVHIDSKTHTRHNESSIINALKNFESKDEQKIIDQDYEELKDAYADRVVDYSDDDENWAAKQEIIKDGPEKYHDILVEFEAVKRIENKLKENNKK